MRRQVLAEEAFTEPAKVTWRVKIERTSRHINTAVGVWFDAPHFVSAACRVRSVLRARCDRPSAWCRGYQRGEGTFFSGSAGVAFHSSNGIGYYERSSLFGSARTLKGQFFRQVPEPLHDAPRRRAFARGGLGVRGRATLWRSIWIWAREPWRSA